MKHARCELWVDERSGEINVLLTAPQFAPVDGKLIPVWDDCEQKVMLNNGEIRVEVVVYNKPLEIDLIKATVRQALASHGSRLCVTS